eukprot:TRINITY_DN31305_c0_g1_i1.p1 TRINITY_DN31305_c0_g1~~TRINITY_DN31305_c0_g1_i1.p1  ORF type:complete len:436 (+),score=46.18 TRINITY_DN31305_c0_g1_i1:197-1309(+)
MPPDVRPTGCKALVEQSSNLPRVSMIIPYLNEDVQHILGSLRSILYFTPNALLQEILMISDGNTPEATYKELLTSLSPKLRVIELPQRLGLIQAKMIGVEQAKAEVLVFMEPHCIVNHQWLEPLLMRIQQNPGTLAMPQLDTIPADNWKDYISGDPGLWRFEWNLNLVYVPLKDQTPPTSPADPFLTPATSGGIFAIKRDFWVRLGLYDEGMAQWGGDHVEATMKVWRCGGRIEVVPCSRVGHLFRSPEQRPYNVDVTHVVRNYARLANVWLDEFLPAFFKVKPEAKDMDIGNLTKQRAQRTSLECKSMKWYVENVDVEMGWEADRICIPGCTGHPSCCPGGAKAPVGRSTIHKTMPQAEYRKRRAKAEL